MTEATHVLVVSMDVDPDHEDLFNEVYDTEHVPYLLEVPGVISARRMKGEAAAFFVGGAINDLPRPSPAYVAFYEIAGPEVISSDAWAAAVERGRWPSVRPHTMNRSAAVYRLR